LVDPVIYKSRILGNSVRQILLRWCVRSGCGQYRGSPREINQRWSRWFTYWL